MANRKRITTYGRRGHNYVRVFEERVGGTRYVRVQWSELPGQPLQTESWEYSTATAKEAKEWAAGTADRLAAGAAPAPKDRTVRELAELHVAAVGEGWAVKTTAAFWHRWKRFEQFLGRHTVARLVTEETLDEFRARMRRAEVATNQRAETIKVVKQVFRWAKRRKLLADNPIADYTMKLAKGEKRTEVPEWKPAEVQRLLQQLEDEHAPRDPKRWRLWVFLTLAAAQGTRQNALRHLSWADVNLAGVDHHHPTARGIELPPRSVWWNPAFDKVKIERAQPLTRPSVRALRVARVWAARLEYTGPWILSGATKTSRGIDEALPAWAEDPRAKKRGRTRRQVKDQPWTYSAFNQALRDLCARALDADGRPVEWVKGRAAHGFRKYSAGQVAELTGSERAAADWIGDQDIRIVRKHYLKRRAEAERRSAGLIGGALPGTRATRNRNTTATGTKKRAPRGETGGAQVPATIGDSSE